MIVDVGGLEFAMKDEAGCEFAMKDITGRRLLPEIKSLAASSTSKETSIGGEGELHESLVALKIQDKLGIQGIPYPNYMSVGEGEPGAGRKKQ